MPGVPPDALNTLKRAFKGMFRKKSKQPSTANDTSQQPPSSQPYSTSTAASPPPSSQPAPPPLSSSPTPQTQANAPQLPPMKQTSPLSTAAEPSKPLPPTHPLSTGRQERPQGSPQGFPQEAVPGNYGAQPGPPAPVSAAGGSAIASSTNPALVQAPAQSQAQNPVSRDVDGTKPSLDQLDEGRVSPAEPTEGLAPDGTRSGAVSAVDDDSRAEEGVKNDSAVEQGKGLESSATDDLPPPPPAKENMPPPITTSTSTAATEQPPTTNGTSAAAPPQEQLARTSSSEEKVAVLSEEPPPLRSVRAAPGMSATSGPLDDFPEGYYPK